MNLNFMENSDDDGSEMDSGSVRMLNNTTISFNADIASDTVDDFLQMLSIVNNQLRKVAVDYEGYTPRVNVLFTTRGGSVYEGFRMSDAIAESDVPVDIFCSGNVASSGLIVLLSGARKLSYPHTKFLYHQISGGMSGTHQQMQGFYKHTEELSRYLKTLVVENTKLTAEQVREMSLEEHWFDSETALEYGFIDDIVTGPLI